MKSIRYRGKDVIDTPTDFGASSDPAELEIIMSNRGAVLTGRVTDDAGNPVRGARVLVLSTNPDRWIAGMAERVTLAPDEKRSLDLRVIKPE